MISNDAGLRATREALANLEEALLGLTRTRAQYHPATFALLSAPIADEIRARRAEIDEYIGLSPASAELAVRNGDGSLIRDRSTPGVAVPVKDPSPTAK
jgi:hypothetical protein